MITGIISYYYLSCTSSRKNILKIDLILRFTEKHDVNASYLTRSLTHRNILSLSLTEMEHEIEVQI